MPSPGTRHRAICRLLTQRKLARTDPNAFIEYVLRDEAERPLRQAPFHEEWQNILTAQKRAVIMAPVEHGKCQPADALVDLADGTSIPIVDVQPGQRIKSWDGSRVVVASAGQVFCDGRREVLRIRLGSGRVVDVTPGHPLWTWGGWKKAGELKVHERVAVPFGRFARGGGYRIKPGMAWLLGLLVGDGGLTVAHRVTATATDRGVQNRLREVCEALGWKATPRRGEGSPGFNLVAGVGSHEFRPTQYLFTDGWLKRCGSHEKRVPEVIMRSGRSTVLHFLSGYFDADGSATTLRGGAIEYYSVSRELLQDVQVLIGRLGIPSRLAPKRGRYKGAIHKSWRLTVTQKVRGFASRLTCHSSKVTTLAQIPRRTQAIGDLVPRSALQNIDATQSQLRSRHGVMLGHGRAISRRLLVQAAKATGNDDVLQRAKAPVWWDEVKQIESIGVMEVWGLPVEGTHAYLTSGVVSHNTVQISIARPLHVMGQRPNVRILLVMAAAHQAYKRLAAVKANIEFNPRVREVFPDLRRDRFGIWATSHIDVLRERATTQHDYTMQAVGVGSDILGSRVDVAILDDVLNFANTATAEQRQKTIDWFETTLLNRVVADGVIWILGTAWHKHDLLHYLSKLVDFSAHRYSAEDGHGGNPIWPEQWTEERLAERRRSLTPWRYAQQLLCQAVDDETARFDSDWFARCRRLGRGLVWPSRRYPGTVVTGLDLAIGLKKKHHETAFFTLGNDPETEKRQPLYIAHGRWKKREIIRRAKAIHKRYGGIFVVENNQAQNYLVQDLEETKIPVIPYTTGKRKLHPEFGIESIGVELENRKWMIASDEHDRQPDDLALWEEQCMDWRPADHAGDLLMASFFALEGLRRFDYGESAIDVG